MIGISGIPSIYISFLFPGIAFLKFNANCGGNCALTLVFLAFGVSGMVLSVYSFTFDI